MIEFDNESDEKLKETFLRINTNSIKLNKNELLFAKINSEDRKKINKLKEDDNYKKICNKSVNDKRFTMDGMLLWIIVIIINYGHNKKTSVRELVNIYVENPDNRIEKINTNIINDFKKTFKSIIDCLGSNFFSSKNFKTLFTAIFLGFYFNIDDHNSYFSKKENIKVDLENLKEDFKNDQMGGGQKFDGLQYNILRIEKVK